MGLGEQELVEPRTHVLHLYLYLCGRTYSHTLGESW